MNEQTARIIINFLEQLGMTVTTKVENLVNLSYPIIVRQVYVNGIKEIIWFIMGVILFYFSYRGIKFIWNNFNDDLKPMIIFFIFPISLGMIFISELFNAIGKFINPHWYSAKLIFDLIKNGGM